MKLEELREEFKVTQNIFLTAKYYELDFGYIHSAKTTLPIVYKTFYLLIERYYYAVTVVLILNLSKLFDKREKFSLVKLRNKMLYNYEKSELNSYLSRNEVETIFYSIENEEIFSLLEKLKKTRDKYYAHLDRSKPSFSEIQINSSETGMLISILENLLKTIYLKFFGVSVDYSLTKGELGHNIFEKLNEF